VTTKTSTTHRSRRRRVLGVMFVLGTVAFAVEFRRPLFSSNFGVVSAGHVYRSAQPSRNLEELIRSKRLGSVLNLRGGSMSDSWYAKEVEITKANGVEFYDFPMSATRRPSRHEILTLLTVFEQCRYPLLIHCKSGSDRTGLASALYRMAVDNVGPDVARDEFTLSHGHVPILDTKRLHEPLDEYQHWLSAEHLAHSPERFREWIKNHYRDEGTKEIVKPLSPGPREKIAETPEKPLQETSRR
jgi:hypothetical protein